MYRENILICKAIHKCNVHLESYSHKLSHQSSAPLQLGTGNLLVVLNLQSAIQQRPSRLSKFCIKRVFGMGFEVGFALISLDDRKLGGIFRRLHDVPGEGTLVLCVDRRSFGEESAESVGVLGLAAEIDDESVNHVCSVGYEERG